MNIKINDNKSVTIDMSDYIREALDQFPEEIKQAVSTPATNNIFAVNEQTEKLSEEHRDIFH